MIGYVQSNMIFDLCSPHSSQRIFHLLPVYLCTVVVSDSLSHPSFVGLDC